MYHILVVDDEYPIREWIGFYIKNKFPEYITETAVNGEEACNKLNLKEYHLIISDIRMPGMDGLELCKRVKELSPSTGIIILSSYSDYDYVRSAFKYHAFDYLLKTEITESNLEIVIKKYFDSLTNSTINIKSEITKTELIKKVIQKEIEDTKEIVEELKELDIQLPKNTFFCFAIKIIHKDSDHKIYIPTFENLNVNFQIALSESVFIFCVEMYMEPSNLKQFQNQADFISQIHKSNQAKIIVSSYIHQDINQFSQIIRNLISCINLDFYGKTLFYINSNSFYDNDDQLDKYYVSILRLINIRKKELIEAELYSLFSFLEENLLPDIENIKRSCIKICESIFISLNQNDSLGVSKYTRKLSAIINNITTFQQLRETVLQELQHLYTIFDYGLESYSSYIKNALLYINKNYSNITGLSEVAEAVFLNSEYFSRLFKKETGVNFNSYINNLRLKKSLEYIRFSDMKIYEIAEKVGFSNFSYFSKRFKDLMGMTPFEYRATYIDNNV